MKMSSEQEPDIIVREVRGEKKVGFRGMQYIDKPESEMRELVERHGDTIIAFYEADETLEGPDKFWRFGEIINKYTSGDVKSSDLEELLRYSTLDIAQKYDLKLYYNFYKMFPNKGYDSNYPWTIYREMVVDKRIEQSKEVFTRLQSGLEDGASPRTYEYRAYLKCESFDLIHIIKALYSLGEDQTSNLTVEKLIEGVQRVRIMAGEDPSIATEEQLYNAIDTIDEIDSIAEDG